MTTFSWFSGKRESSRKCMSVLLCAVSGDGSEVGADDSGTLHLSDAGPVVLDGVVLGAAVVPDGEAVLRPPPADLELRDGGLTDQVVEELALARRVVVAESHVPGGVVIREMRGEGIYEEDLLARLGMSTDH